MVHDLGVPVDELDVWKAARSGHPGARDELTFLVTVVARPYLRAKGVPRDDLESLVQEVQLSVSRALVAEGLEVNEVRGFLKARAHGIFSEFLRKRRRGGDILDVELPLGPVDGATRLAKPRLIEKLGAALEDCRDRLGDEHRRVWVGRYERGLGTRDLAAELSLPVKTVHAHLFRARGEVWDCLERKKVLE